MLWLRLQSDLGSSEKGAEGFLELVGDDWVARHEDQSERSERLSHNRYLTHELYLNLPEA